MENLINNKYGLLKIPTKGSGLCWKVLNDGDIWEDDTIKFIINNSNNKGIVSAGSYVGDFLVPFSKHTSASILSFEPLPENIYFTMENIKLNKLNNVIFSSKALSNNNGKTLIKTTASGWCEDYKNSSEILGEKAFIPKSLDDKENTIEIECIKLDDFMMQLDKSIEISIIQLDIEGHEIEALEGARNTIKNNLPILILEEGSNTEPNNYFYHNFLKNLGYIYYPNKIGHAYSPTHFFGNYILFIPSKHNLKFD